MSAAITAAHAFMAVMRRDLHVYLSYRTRLVSQVMTALFSLTLFYYLSRLVHVSGFSTPARYFGFVVVGLALLSVVYSCFSIPEYIRQELVAGTFERLLLSPFGPVRAVTFSHSGRRPAGRAVCAHPTEWATCVSASPTPASPG